jgi:hypothetical protein
VGHGARSTLRVSPGCSTASGRACSGIQTRRCRVPLQSATVCRTGRKTDTSMQCATHARHYALCAVCSDSAGVSAWRAQRAGPDTAGWDGARDAYSDHYVSSSGDVGPASLSVIPVISLAAGARAESATVGGPGFAALGSVAALLGLCMLLECAASQGCGRSRAPGEHSHHDRRLSRG